MAHMKNLNAEFAAMKKPALQQEMRARGLDDSGKKADMLCECVSKGALAN